MSDCEVIEFPRESTADVRPESVLGLAVAANLAEVIVVGRRQDGALFFGTSSGDAKSAWWLLRELLEAVRAGSIA